MRRFLFLILLLAPSLCWGQFATLSTGGTSDSIGVDVDGGAVDDWLYPAYLREGTNVTFTVTGDTLTIAGQEGAGTADTTWVHNDANDDSIMASNSAIHLEWGSGIDVTIVGDTATVVVDDAELTLSGIGGAVTDGQVPDSIAITLADGSVTYLKMQTNYADSLGNLYQNETIAGNWVNTASPWTDNEIATSGNWNTAYGWGDHSGQGYITATLTEEEVEDYAGTMVDGGTETRIAVTYTDGGVGAGLFNFVVDDMNDDVPESGDFGAAADLDADGSITDQTITKSDTDTTSSNFVFDGAYHITSAETDSQFMSKKYIDDAAGGLVAQSVKGDHVDSTSENFVFDGAYHITSAEAGSAYVTIWTAKDAIGDSLAANWNTWLDDDDLGVDEAYGAGWNGDANSPEKDDIYDYLHVIDTDDDGDIGDETITLSGNWVNTANPWAVNEGGTGAATFTDGGILLGSGTGAITALGVATNGQIPIGDGTTDPVLATVTGGTGITVTNGAGTISIANDLGASETDPTVDTEAECETEWGSVNILLEEEIDASSEFRAIMDDETGTGVLVFGTSPTFTTGITVPNNSISDEELDEGANFTWTGTHDFGGATSLEIPAVDDPTTDAEGETAWDTNDDAFEVYMGSESESALIPAYQKLDAHVFAPDGINDEICIFRVDALIYPFGIEIDQVSITLPADAAYSMVFEEWAGDPPVAQNDISTVTTGSGDAYAEEAPDTDAALDADDYIFLHVPNTDVDWIHVQVIYHINDGN